jgi:nucleoside-diphosphate-sugar epimerase
MRNREGGSEEESNDGGKDMKVLLAGATGTLGVPLVRALIAGGNDVIGLSRTPCKRDMLRALGAESLVADVMDQQALLKAVDGLEADAVIHQMTALKKIPTRHRDMAATDALREVGTANLLAAARLLGARRFVTQSFFMGYGYGDWGERILTEDDPFAPPGGVPSSGTSPRCARLNARPSPRKGSTASPCATAPSTVPAGARSR